MITKLSKLIYHITDDCMRPGEVRQYVAGDKAERILPIVKPYGIEIFDGIIYVGDIRTATITTLNLKKRKAYRSLQLK